MAETEADADRGASLARFSVEERKVPDSNSGSNNSVLLQTGQLRLNLMRRRDVTDAYTTLDVAMVTERRADHQLLLQKDIIPPMLHAGSNPALSGYVTELYGLLNQRGEALASRVAQPGIGGVAQIADFLLLQTVNRYQPLFTHFSTHPLLHPEHLSSACLCLAGDLATFTVNRRRPLAYPEYEHDALARCFIPLIADLRRSLSMVLEQSAISIPLQDR